LSGIFAGEMVFPFRDLYIALVNSIAVQHAFGFFNLCHYSTSALLTAVIARAILSVRVSVCLTITFWCFVQTKNTIMWFSALVAVIRCNKSAH